MISPTRTLLVILAVLIPFKSLTATFTITSDSDQGNGTLRDAILMANSTSGKDTLNFNLSGVGPWVINLITQLPALTDSITINGLSQPFSQYPSNLVSIIGYNISADILKIQTTNCQLSGIKIANSATHHGVILGNIPNAIINFNKISFKNMVFQYCAIGIYGKENCYQNLYISECSFINCMNGILITTYDYSNNLKISDNYFSAGLASGTRGCFIDFIQYCDTCSESIYITGNHILGTSEGIGINVEGYLDTILIDSNYIEQVGASAIGLAHSFLQNTQLLRISNNIIDSSMGGGIVIDQGGVSGKSFIDRIEVINNQVLGCNFDCIYIIQSGTGSFKSRIGSARIHNNTLEAHQMGVRYQAGGTGYLQTYLNRLEIDSNQITGISGAIKGCDIESISNGYKSRSIRNIFIRNNTISNFQEGVKIINSGAGSATSLIENFHINENSISNCQFYGIHFRISGSSTQHEIRNGTVLRNNIHHCGQDGILIENYATDSIKYRISNIKISQNLIYQNNRHGIFLDNLRAHFSSINMRKNSIFENDSMGIKTVDDLNRYGQPVIPSPIIDSINGNFVFGHINALSNTVYAIELFNSSTINSANLSQGETYLKTKYITTGPAGLGTFSISLNGLSNLHYLSATATDTIISTTSPFSNTINYLTVGFDDAKYSGLQLYPNPANEYITIEFANRPAFLNLLILNSEGKTISTVQNNSFTNKIHVSTKLLPNDTYLICSELTHQLVGKFIVLH